MGFWKDYGLGVKTYGQSLKFISKNKLWYFFLFPLVVSVALGIGMIYLRGYIVAGTEEGAMSAMGLDKEQDGFWGWMVSAFSWVIKIVVWLLVFLIWFKIKKYVVFILLSPFMAWMSEKTEAVLTGNAYDLDWAQLFKDILRGVLIALRNIFMELLLTLVMLPINLIPVIGSIAYTIWCYMVAWYYCGYGTMDYVNERRRLNVRESNRSIRQLKGMAIGNGMLFSWIFIVPILGVLVAPVLGTVAAVLAMHERLDLAQNEYARKEALPQV